VACAVPVRGRLIGPECLSKVLVDLPLPLPVPEPVPARGDRLALAGFGMLVVLSMLPWSRFGDSRRYFGAWAPHWSLGAALAGVAGVLVVLFGRYRSVDPRLETATYGGLALVAGVAAFLSHRKPPLLAEPTVWPWFAVAAAAVVLLGALVKLAALMRARRPARSTGL
jgi:hypothetical protein